MAVVKTQLFHILSNPSEVAIGPETFTAFQWVLWYELSCAVAQNAAKACHMKKLSNNHKNLLNHKKCDWRFTRFIHYYPAH